MSHAKDMAVAVRAVRRILGGTVVGQEKNDVEAPTTTRRNDARGMDTLWGRDERPSGNDKRGSGA